MKRSNRSPSVAKLGTAIEKAIDRGDEVHVKSLVEQMIAIVVGTVDGYSGEESVHAFQWLAAHDGGVLDDVMRRRLWQNPEILVEAARSLRRLAREGLHPKTRQEAADALKRYGLDDESLKNFPED